MKHCKLFPAILLVLVTITVSCRQSTEKEAASAGTSTEFIRPDFSSDSAFVYIEKQVAFGPRIPGTPAQQKCADWMAGTLQRLGWEVVRQSTTVTLYNNQEVPCINIIGSVNPSAQRRLLLCAHWDTRPFADQYAPDPYAKLDGADDGASGVAVLLEVARQIQYKKPDIGVDILFVDVEDWGEHANERTDRQDTYCLGTQYWSRNPHKPGYTADNGILLDMVGAKGAVFGMEGSSMHFAPEFMRQVWDIANGLGHGSFFSYDQQPEITDDHIYINQLAGIPTIDIINFGTRYPKGFPPHWHTPDDNITVIDKNTLQAVGETVLAVVHSF